MRNGFLQRAGATLRAFVEPSTWRLAWRNVGRNGRRSAIVLCAAAVGVCGGLLTMAVSYGTALAMVETAIATELGHLQIHAQGFNDDPGLAHRLPQMSELGGDLAHDPAILAWAPRLRTEGLAYSSRASAGTRVVGVDPERESELSLLERSVIAGEYFGPKKRRAMLGADLAARLRVETGDKIVLSIQDKDGEMVSELFRVAGIFRTPLPELDQATIFVRLHELQPILGVVGEISETAIRADPKSDLPALANRVRAASGVGTEVHTWDQLRPILVFLVAFFEAQAGAMYGAVFIAMLFGIANVMLMAVVERIPEFGILGALGMPPARIGAMIVAESLMLSLLGLAVGIGLTFAVIALLGDGIDVSRFTMARAYGVGFRIVPALRFSDWTVPSIAAVATAIVASLAPVLRARRIRPAEALRHV